MQRINICGSIIGSSGYSVHTKSLANALHRQGFDVRIDTPTYNGMELGLSDVEMSMITKPYNEDCTTVFVGLPPFWRLSLADNPKHFIGYCVWEGSEIPAYWLPYLLDHRVDQIWVPSQHVYDAIINAFPEDKYHGVPAYLYEGDIVQKMHVIPHGVDLALFKPAESRPERPFTFLVNKGFSGSLEDRGGVQYAMKAFKEEFKAGENVRMLVKINPAYIPAPVEQRDLWLQSVMQNLNLPTDGAEMQITTSDLPYEQLPDFYHEGDVLVNATRCEGFGLNGLEAHACGLPTISTGYGGQVSYMSKEIDFVIDYTLEPVKNDIQYESISWAVPSIQHLRGLMRYCYENQAEVRTRGLLAAQHSLNWTWNHTGQIAAGYINELP